MSSKGAPPANPPALMSYQTLQQTLGYLGIGLPFILLAGNGFHAESSISYFYYTDMSVVFTGILISFAIFLIAYRGYERDTARGERISDNIWTNIGGMLALATALIPTSYGEEMGIPEFPFAHNNRLPGTIHLLCASGFLICMAWMSYFKFTLSKKDGRLRMIIYRVSGLGVCFCLLAMGIGMIRDVNFTGIDVFIGETVALFFFGISWLVKGKGLSRIGL